MGGRWTPPAIKTPTPKEKEDEEEGEGEEDKEEGEQSELRTTETTDQNPFGAFLPNWGLAFNPSGRWSAKVPLLWLIIDSAIPISLVIMSDCLISRCSSNYAIQSLVAPPPPSPPTLSDTAPHR